MKSPKPAAYQVYFKLKNEIQKINCVSILHLCCMFCFLVIVIANTLDLFWRTMTTLKDKGVTMTDLPFRQYSKDDFKNIISHRIKMLGGATYIYKSTLTNRKS